MRFVRIVSPGWETFTGSLGHGCLFENGLSINQIDIRNIRRIGSNVMIEDAETGEQLGPAAELVNSVDTEMTTLTLPTHEEERAQFELDAELEAQRIAELEQQIQNQKAADDAALKAVSEKQMADGDIIVYSRQELEAIATNDGIGGLREIGKTLQVKDTSISGLIDKILDKQNAVMGA